jgi:hypothetical protein
MQKHGDRLTATGMRMGNIRAPNIPHFKTFVDTMVSLHITDSGWKATKPTVIL